MEVPCLLGLAGILTTASVFMRIRISDGIGWPKVRLTYPRVLPTYPLAHFLYWAHNGYAT
jgi:hypothetical protein